MGKVQVVRAEITLFGAEAVVVVAAVTAEAVVI
jgi:hypothetical protein